MARKRTRWLILIAVIVIAAAAVAYAARTKGNRNGKEEKGPEIPTLAARIDDVQVVVREVGTVGPKMFPRAMAYCRRTAELLPAISRGRWTR